MGESNARPLHFSTCSLGYEVEFPGLPARLPGRWVAFWYRHLRPRPAEDVQPQVNVSFRNLDSSDPRCAFRTARVAVTALGQLRLGSVLKDGCLSKEFELPSRRFSVEFTPDSGKQWISTELLSSARLPDWFCDPVDSVRAESQSDEDDEDRLSLGGPGLGLPLRGGGVLWIPCLEFFSRFWGRSQEVKRVLLTYPWDEVQRRFFAPVAELDESVWPIQYGTAASRLVNGDAVLLAHLLHDRRDRGWLQRRARDPYTRLEKLRSTLVGQQSHTRYLSISPWFLGPARLLVRGFPLPDRSFLALRVDGGSDPPGPPSIRHFRSIRQSAEPDPDDSDAQALADAPGYVIRRRPRPDPVRLASEVSPDRVSPQIELLDRPFELLGKPRRVERRSVIWSGARARLRAGPEEARAYATGERSGPEKGVGFAHEHAPEASGSRGARFDLWAALCHLHTWHPDWIQSVGWLDSSGVFVALGPPARILTLDITGMSHVPRWVWIDPSRPDRERRPRGLLVARVEVRADPRFSETRSLYLVEIQRRLLTHGKDRKFSGLVLELNEPGDSGNALAGWLARVRAALPRQRGVFRKPLRDACPGWALLFNHSSSKYTDLPGEAAVRNALRKMGVWLPF